MGRNRTLTLPTPIPSKQREFSIPFEIRSDGSADPPKEVELMVSEDRGVHWHSWDRVSVENKKFDFKTSNDGEFWFAFRMIMLSGQVKPSGTGPQIRVLVDATPPVLTVELLQQPSGEIRVQWKAEDRNLQGKMPEFAVSVPPSPVSMETEKTWIPLAIDQRNVRTGENGLEGMFLFWPENGLSTLELRAAVADSVGNRVEKKSSMTIRPVQREMSQIAADRAAAEHLKLDSRPDSPASFPERQESPLLSGNTPGSVPGAPSYSPQQVPLIPPKPVRTQSRAAEKNRSGENSTSQRPKKEEMNVLPLPDGTTLAREYQPMPSLVSPEGEYASPDEDPLPLMPEKPKPDPLTEELLANMKIFYERESEKKAEKEAVRRAESAIPPSQRPKLMSPANSNMSEPGMVRENVPGTISAPANLPVSKEWNDRMPALPPLPERSAATSSEKKTLFPGSITGISLGNDPPQPRIIVKWMIGDKIWQGAIVDVLRSSSLEGSWLPIATNLQNKGEYWWFLTPDDLKPFYIAVRCRNSTGVVNIDSTPSPIQIDPKLLNPPQNNVVK